MNRSREQLGAAGRRLSPVPGHVQAVKNGLDSAIGARRGIHSRLSQAAADASRITERIARLESFVLQSVQRYDNAERQLISRAAAVEELAGRSVNEAAFRLVDWDEVDVRVQLLAKKLGGLLPQIAGLIDEAEERAAENLQQLIAASAHILAAITEFVIERVSLVVLNVRDSQPKPVNIANLNLLAAAYGSERKKLVDVDQLFSGDKLDADILDFLAYVVQKGFHPVTFEGLPYWDWHIAAEKLKEIQDANAAEPRFWGIDLAEGLYEGGKSGLMGIASFGYDLYDDPWGTAKAIGEGAKQISIDIYNETNKLLDDPWLYVNNKAIDLKMTAEEFFALSPNEQARLIGETLGREVVYAAAGGVALKSARGVISVAGKAGTRLDEVSIQIRQGAVMLVDNAKLAGQRLADPGWLRPLNIAPAGASGMPDVRLMDGGKQELSPKKNAVQENYLRAMDEKAAGTGEAVLNNGRATVDTIKSNPIAFKGKSADEIAQMLRNEGYDVTVQDSTKSSSGAKIIKINNTGDNRNITQVQVSPGGGRHGGSPYVKISTNDQGIIKVVDGAESAYKTDGKETATIIFTGGD
ncbi:hypothetical protein [Paenibacillus tarimensis]|uniref:hypothetical protein n=3 Tax=Paenibacillus tarimensis TaxID=416012 RepID=UPI0039F0A752